ncbi:MAG: hypothetical protein R3F54_19170 [Alphaproteobacteria bacterium]
MTKRELTHHGLTTDRQPGSHSLAFPSTLSVVMPVAEPRAEDDFARVQALDGLITFLTPICQHAFRSMGSWEFDGERKKWYGTDSQGRMDLPGSLAAKVKDFVYPAAMRALGLGGLMSRLGS